MMVDSPSPSSSSSSAPVENPSVTRRPSSHLNLPPNMSRAALSIQTPFQSSSLRLPDLTTSSSNHPSPSSTSYSDRFIPSRSSSNFALFSISPSSTPSPDSTREDGSSTYSMLLRTVLFGPDSPSPISPVTPEKSPGAWAGFDGLVSTSATAPSRNIFRFKTERQRVSPYSLSPDGFDGALPGVISSPTKTPRKVPRSPYKVLDAPALQDDFYLNLVDWSLHNVLAVGLGNCVYLWNACSSKIWDASRCRRVRTMEGHRMQVGALAWSSTLLSSGGRDKTIFQHDMRAQEDSVSKLTGHKSEVCGLKWSFDNHELASCGNDNKLFIWNQHSTQPVLKYCKHMAAVKAIA